MPGFERAVSSSQSHGTGRGPLPWLFSGRLLPAVQSEFELWADLERSAWESHYLEALAALVEAQAAQGKYLAAIEYARRYLAIDDLAEEMHRRLMVLYAAIGDRGAASHNSSIARWSWSVSWGSSLAGDPGRLPGCPGRSTTHHAICCPAATRLDNFAQLGRPLVGREQALRQLARAYTSAGQAGGAWCSSWASLASANPGYCRNL